jgi:hypothetical protein
MDDNADDNDDCGTVHEMIGRGNQVLEEYMPQCPFVHHKSHMR